MFSFKNKKVLITGADGFIGSHLTEALLEAGAEVTAFVYYNSFNSWGWIDSFEKEKRDALRIFSGDIRDPNGVREAVIGQDYVCQPAALTGIPLCYHLPYNYVDTNNGARSMCCRRTVTRGRSVFRCLPVERSAAQPICGLMYRPPASAGSTTSTIPVAEKLLDTVVSPPSWPVAASVQQ